MTRQQHLAFCAICVKRAFDPNQGIVCGLTKKQADFENVCTFFEEDVKEKEIEQGKIKQLKSETNKNLNRGRIALFVIAGLYILAGFLEAFVIEYHHILFGIIDWFIAFVFIGLGFLSIKKPLAGMVSGLIFYLLIHVLLALADPMTLFSGIIWKLFILSSLIYGIKTATNEAEKQKKESALLIDQL